MRPARSSNNRRRSPQVFPPRRWRKWRYLFLPRPNGYPDEVLRQAWGGPRFTTTGAGPQAAGHPTWGVQRGEVHLFKCRTRGRLPRLADLDDRRCHTITAAPTFFPASIDGQWLVEAAPGPKTIGGGRRRGRQPARRSPSNASRPASMIPAEADSAAPSSGAAKSARDTTD